MPRKRNDGLNVGLAQPYTEADEAWDAFSGRDDSTFTLSMWDEATKKYLPVDTYSPDQVRDCVDVTIALHGGDGTKFRLDRKVNGEYDGSKVFEISPNARKKGTAASPL